MKENSNGWNEGPPQKKDGRHIDNKQNDRSPSFSVITLNMKWIKLSDQNIETDIMDKNMIQLYFKEFNISTLNKYLLLAFSMPRI